MSKLAPEDAAHILAEALTGHIACQSGHRIEGCDAIGQILSGTIDDVRVDYLFKYNLQTSAWMLAELTPGKYRPNDILYYHGTIEDTVTQAALYGDDVVPDGDDIEL